MSGSAFVYSGRTGKPLMEFAGEHPGALLGYAVAGIGDADGDARPDIAVGAPGAIVGGQPVGAARVYSGADGTELLSSPGASPGGFYGAAVAAAGDPDADGLADLLVGAPSDHSAGPAAGLVRAVDGADGEAMMTLRGVAGGDQFGRAVAAVGDLDRDGSTDVAIGLPGAVCGGGDAGAVEVRSGDDGAPLVDDCGRQPDDQYGAEVAGIGDANGDGIPDFIAGAGVGGYAVVFLNIAPPLGAIDLDDLTAFGPAFLAREPRADTDGNGSWDLDDVRAFVDAFQGGCP
jgi:hypothetical protein